MAEWFPKCERAFATGIFNAGMPLRRYFPPLIVPYIASAWGWPMAFYLAGGLGVIWIASRIIFTANRTRICASVPPSFSTSAAIRSRALKSALAANHRLQTDLGVFPGKIHDRSDLVVLTFWLPPFLHSHFKLDLKHFGPPLVIVYLMADGVSIAGGWCVELLTRGWSVNAGRKTAMLIWPFVFCRSCP